VLITINAQERGDSMPINAKTNVSQIVKAAPHQGSSMQIQQAYIVNNNAHINQFGIESSPINHNSHLLSSSSHHRHSNAATHQRYQPCEEEDK